VFYGTCVCPVHAVCNPIISTSTLQGHPGSKVHGANRKAIDGLLSKSNIVSVTIFDICRENPWPRSRTVQGHSRSKFMLLIDSAWVISRSTYIDHNIVSATIFEIFDVQFEWPWITTVEGHPRSKFMVPIGSPLDWCFPLWLLLCLTLYLSRYLRYFMRKFCDLDHPFWYQLKARIQLPIGEWYQLVSFLRLFWSYRGMLVKLSLLTADASV